MGVAKQKEAEKIFESFPIPSARFIKVCPV
jgi:hypothetical protein